MWQRTEIEGIGKVLLTIELSVKGDIIGIEIDRVDGSPIIANQIIELLRQGQPYRDVMKDFRGPRRFQLLFSVKGS